MGVGEIATDNIMSGIENTGSVKQHNHKKKLRQRFDIIKKLGQGTFGKVQLGINKETGQEVAIKTIKKSKIESDADLVRIRREIQIMSSVQHPNIIHIYEVFENREKMVLVMEYAAGGELYDYLSERKVLAEEEARRIFRQIATACYYCHKHKICHRDLKLENILLDENNNAKIADFGLSNVFDDQRLLNTFCGSPLYASPEIVKGTPYHGPEVDCWSLGVLLYTLVYGAMPFDGSNFKRLVKQISQGDYYEPSKPSPASPLIRDMLTVNPRNRASIEKICSHWWVNENYKENCLEISEELANQTPVRLDVLLALAPPPPQLESDKLVVTGDVEDTRSTEQMVPTRSQSMGSIMDIPNRERIIAENEAKFTPKRKLESSVSTDQANLIKGLKRKDKIIKENTVADITVHGTIQEDASVEDTSMSEPIPLNKSLTKTLSKEMDVEQTEEVVDPSLQGAACAEIIQEAEQKNNQKPKVRRTLSTSISNKILEGINEIPSQENLANNVVDKENVKEVKAEAKPAEKAAEEKPEIKPVKKKVVKKKVLVDKNQNSKEAAPPEMVKEKEKVKEKTEAEASKEPSPAKHEASPTSKPVERRKSRIFEAAEKFQSMISPTEQKPVPKDKPKKIVIPGVSVDGFKKEFERKASLTSESPPKLRGPVKKTVSIETPSDETEPEKVTNNTAQSPKSPEADAKPEPKETTTPIKTEDDRQERVKNAVNIISNALDKEGTRKSKSRPCVVRKPPVPFGSSGRSASGNIGLITSPLSPPIQNMGPKPFVKPVFEKAEPKQVQEQEVPEEEKKTSSAEITLKSATLPRRKTTKAQIQLNYPMPKPVQMEFKTEMAHNVEAMPKPAMQRSEVVVPVSSPTSFRSVSLEPESRGSKERIIPISVEHQGAPKEAVQSPPPKPPVSKTFQTQRSNISQRSNSLSRQSTQESDTDTIGSNGEPIKKSPREYIIPIAVEGGGYVTPRAGSLEPSDTASTTSTMTGKSKFGKTRRVGLSDRESEDESPFTKLHRHSSFSKDSDNEDSRSGTFHMHKLRSTRPKRSTLEHNDSLSSGEDDDDEGFEILTAENLFSTLLSRVRDLTHRLNVDDGIRPGFPSSRLLSHFDQGTNFWNRADHPLTRHSSLGRSFGRSSAFPSTKFGTPWRTISREVPDSVFSDDSPTKTSSTARVPRGDNASAEESLNLADLDLKKLKLSEEDALALSYLTPGLSKRIQKQLLAQLAPSEARKLHRTMSACDPSKDVHREPKVLRRSAEKMPSTLPRKFSSDRGINSEALDEDKPTTKTQKSFLPVKSSIEDYQPSYNLNVRSSSIGAEPRGNIKFVPYKPRLSRTSFVKEPSSYSVSKSDLQSPDSSISESLSKNDSSYRKDDSISEHSSKYSDSSASRPYSKYSSDSLYSRYTPTRSLDASYSANPSSLSSNSSKKTGTSRVSRFLRPDFYDAPKEENVYLKEKKEREMETQKVLKEIRDKRKSRLSSMRERSASRDRSSNSDLLKSKGDTLQKNEHKDTNKLLSAVSDSIKNLEQQSKKTVHDYVNVLADNKQVDNTQLPLISDTPQLSAKVLHEYVNVKAEPSEVVNSSSDVTEKKERTSKIARPKSYPTDATKKIAATAAAEKEHKTSKLKKVSSKIHAKEKSKEEKNETNRNINEEEKGHKNKLLQSIEKKLEKFRSSTASAQKNPEEAKALQEKKSTVENAIKRLREQSLPRRLDGCTESGLLKRAVSVEDMPGSKPLQTSRKSVTKILGLFKKYEEQENKKALKKSKAKDNKNSEINDKLCRVDSDKDNAESVIVNNKTNDNQIVNYANGKRESKECNASENAVTVEKKERPRSLLLDKVKHFQNAYNGAKSDTVLDVNAKEVKTKSRLPVTSFRRSLNLDNLPAPPMFYRNPNKDVADVAEVKPRRERLKLDISRVLSPSLTVVEPGPSTTPDENHRENRNSLATTDESSLVLSPTEDYLSCDSWSVCSDFHHTSELNSPISQNGSQIFSGDEGESVIDRIRRKSFYTRFNEKKRPRKHSIAGSYKDLDLLYKPASDYSSLDRKTLDYRNPRSSRTIYVPETSREYRPYTRSASVFNDYVNVPGSYHTLGSKIARPLSRSLYSDPEDSSIDDVLTAKTPSKHISYMPRLSRASVSPSTEELSSPISSAALYNGSERS